MAGSMGTRLRRRPYGRAAGGVFRKVYASDKYPYGYGDSDTDFLTTHLDGFDWIITNPPFNDSADSS